MAVRQIISMFEQVNTDEGKDAYDCNFRSIATGNERINAYLFILTKGEISHIIRREKKLEKFSIEYYIKSNNSCPAQEFMDSLDKKMRAKLLRLQLLLEENGNTLTEPYSKYLEDGIFELRAHQRNNIARVLYFFVVGQKIIITNGFIKKTQKTPKREIQLAKKYRAEYMKKVGNKHG